MPLSVLLSVPPDTTGEHLKNSMQIGKNHRIKISSRRSVSSEVSGDPGPCTKILYYIFNNSSCIILRIGNYRIRILLTLMQYILQTWSRESFSYKAHISTDTNGIITAVAALFMIPGPYQYWLNLMRNLWEPPYGLPPILNTDPEECLKYL